MIDFIPEKPFILITNDDGVDAPGIKALVKAVRGLGQIVVVAPDGPRSGQSSAITPNKALVLTKIDEKEDLWVYASSGTPVDCVKLALNSLFKRKPDLILSGINHGSNAAVNILYSGTMGAVLEGCVMQIPAVGFSLCDFAKDADFSHSLPFVRRITEVVLEKGLKKGVCLNVNIPKCEKLEGMKVCRQAVGHWTQEFELRVDEQGNPGYWLGGVFQNLEPEAEDTDEWALRHNYVSVVPCQVDMTAHDELDDLQYMETL